VKLGDQSKLPLTDVARDLGLEYATLYGWMKKAGKTKKGQRPVGTAASSPQTPEAMQAEIERLRRELEETRKQLEFAKKAAAFFAQQKE
jgi:transposase